MFITLTDVSDFFYQCLIDLCCLLSEAYTNAEISCTCTDDEDEELLILRPVGPGIQDLETGDVFAASYSTKNDGKCDF